MIPKCEGMLLTNSKREAVKHISFSFTIIYHKKLVSTRSKGDINENTYPAFCAPHRSWSCTQTPDTRF